MGPNNPARYRGLGQVLVAKMSPQFHEVVGDEGFEGIKGHFEGGRGPAPDFAADIDPLGRVGFQAEFGPAEEAGPSGTGLTKWLPSKCLGTWLRL